MLNLGDVVCVPLDVLSRLPQHPDLAGLINKIKDCEDDKLHQLLKDLLPHNTPWQYPRGDMHHWIPVLDKFDAIYEAKIEQYNVETVQIQEFAEDDKQLLLEILRVEKLVMDNATSRKIFASYDVSIRLAMSRAWVCLLVD
jgi:E3 ubiquitin-protein ligase HUWE1